VTKKPGLLGGRRSIRYPILAIAWVPSLVLMMIGLVVTGALAYQGAQMRSFNDRFAVASPQATSFTTAMFAERRAAQLQVVNPQARPAELADARVRVDAALKSLTGVVRPLADDYPETYGQLDQFLTSMATNLPAFRQRVDRLEASIIEVSVFYSTIGTEVANWLNRNAVAEPASASGVEQTIAVTLMRATDELLDTDALSIASFLERDRLSTAEYALLSQRFGAARSRLYEVMPLLRKSEQEDLGSLMDSREWRTVMQAYGLALSTRGPAAAVPQASATKDSATKDKGTAKKQGTASRRNGADEATGADLKKVNAAAATALPPELGMNLKAWDTNTARVIRELITITLHHSRYAADISGEQGATQLRRSAFVGVALLILAVVVFLATTLASNRIIRRLRRLRSETLLLAHERLPRIMSQLRQGDPVDLRAELPPLSFGEDEIAQVAEAFEEAQRMAVGAAAREAETRAGLRTVFLDIAHRSQAIVHRQLKVLDKAERAQEDPDQLALLFQLDHLSTRARRNAENLIILGGEQAGRQWRNPVPLIEVVRSAISEAEDYVRVSIGALPRLTLKGAAVADVIHLIAELVDNATSFSPPMSRVEVRGNMVGRGVVIEVEDQGLGIEPGQMEELNQMLHEPPDFQVMALADEPRLGLFVVGQLASRHGIRVTITPSPAYGGTRVVVLLPSTLISGDPALSMPREHANSPSDSTGSPATPGLGTPRALGLGQPKDVPSNGNPPRNGGMPPMVGSPRPSLDAAMAAPDLFPTSPVPTDPPSGGDLPPRAAPPLSADEVFPPRPEQPRTGAGDVAGQRPPQDGPGDLTAPPGRPWDPGPQGPVVAGPVVGPDEGGYPAPESEASLRAPGLFEAPLRDTGLFEPGPRTGLPYPVNEVPPPPPVPPLLRRPERAPGDPVPPGGHPSGPLPADTAHPHGLLPEVEQDDLFPQDPSRPFTAHRGERVSALMGDESTRPPIRRPVPQGRPALPRRNRQTHLSPKLMETPDEGPATAQGGTGRADDMSMIDIPDAEQARSRMSALQRGTLRGRATDPEGTK
jgi:signal transduction histidine kinase